ncbi:MAG: T9SS type B sorting domain-containing protein [Saprospiraceae bacterium]|nr:T9SS type B sorting domain-containing protein [Saprospiraceae bacterium]
MNFKLLSFYLSFILTTVISLQNLTAAHIIGGEMFYECLGFSSLPNGQTDSTTRKYLITIKLYRDCRPQQQAAGFDMPLGFTIYRRSANNVYRNVRTGNREFSATDFEGPNLIDSPVYPCLELPPDICVESGTYTFEVDLPIINEEYVIIWQRCCRNNTITNILNPGGTGATFTISIHPESQRTCNSSPKFVNFPPTVVCVNNPLNFDHSAVDKEGDLLVYSFCEPFGGGGQGGGGGNNCTAVTPSPDCPPPYPKVNFRAPQYSYLFPMGGNPPVSINSLTGLITGEPNAQGQYVVSVCCSEYRNGILLSTLRRDFQFNVASCVGTVVAKLNNGKEVSKQNYEILLCGEDTLQMNNGSYQQRFINSVLWEYDNGGTTESSTLWNPFIKFKEGGIHNGRFILNPGTNCSDTVNFRINIISDLKADFSFSYDSCKFGPVNFKDLSKSTYSNIVNWSWDFGDGFKGFDPNYELQYFHPDNYGVTLDIIDDLGCKKSVVKNLSWFPAPNVIVFRPSVTEGCVPLTVSFKNISFPTDDKYKFNWTFSDGLSVTGINVSRRFDSIGLYGLKLKVTSPVGCVNEGSFDNVISVLSPPTAKWSVDPLIVNLNNPYVQGYDSTEKTIGRDWIIDNKDYYFDKEINYAFKDTGYHTIRMIVNDKYLCTDTLETQIYAFRDFTLYMPNAFTPNGDGNNEVFGPVGFFQDVETYSLKIFDRWGSLIFESDRPEIAWNGKSQNSDKTLPPGTYVYNLKYKQSRKELIEEKKLFTLIR